MAWEQPLWLLREWQQGHHVRHSNELAHSLTTKCITLAIRMMLSRSKCPPSVLVSFEWFPAPRFILPSSLRRLAWQQAGPTLSTSYAANMNEWQKVVGRKEAANDQVWVWPEAVEHGHVPQNLSSFLANRSPNSVVRSSRPIDHAAYDTHMLRMVGVKERLWAL